MCSVIGTATFYSSKMEALKKWMFGSQLPEQMREDPELKDLNISGPFGCSHDRLRKAYYNMRDGKEQTRTNQEIYKDFTYVCYDSPELWKRSDDTPKELNVICNRVIQMFRDNEKV